MSDEDPVRECLSGPTPRDIKIPESGLSSFGQDMALRDSRKEILPCQVGKIGPNGAEQIAKLLDRILALDSAFGVHQQGLMFICSTIPAMGYTHIQ